MRETRYLVSNFYFELVHPFEKEASNDHNIKVMERSARKERARGRKY